MTKLSAGVLLLMTTLNLHAQDHRAAIIAALRNWRPETQVETRQIELPVVPRCEAANENWNVKGARFDPGLGAWVVQVNCPGSALPFMAIVHVKDPRCLRPNARSKGTVPLLVRAGERKKLAVEFAGGRITRPVVCLRSGRAGDWIRVRWLDSKVVQRVLVGEMGDLILAGRQ